MITEAERAFSEEVRDKKRAANGVHNKTGKRGYVGKMYLPFELLRGKEKRAYKKSGKVRIYKMIMPLEAFKELDKEGRKKHLEEILPNYTKEEIKNTWGITDLYYYMRQVGLMPQKSRQKREGERAQVELTLETDSQQKPLEQQQQTEIEASIADLQEALLRETEEKEELLKKIRLLEDQQAAQDERINRVIYSYQKENKALYEQIEALNGIVNNLANQFSTLTITQQQQPGNEILSKVRSLETDMQLLKLLATR